MRLSFALFLLALGAPNAAATPLQQSAKFLASDGAANDDFGWSVAVSGQRALVGSHWDSDNGLRSGSAYVFDTSTGAQLAKLLPSDGAAQDEFGFSVGLSGTTAILGAPDDDDNGQYSGSAYLFDVSTGQQLVKLVPSDGEPNEFFGWSVAISNTVAIIGAQGDDDNGANSGSAYLYDASAPGAMLKLLPNDGAANDGFGWSVGISGGTAIVGAYQKPTAFSPLGGVAYLFDVATGAQTAKLIPSAGDGFQQFGVSVAVSGGTAVVGTRYGWAGFAPGAAFVFDVTTGLERLRINGPANFGETVAISGSTLAIGAYQDSATGSISGVAYVADANTGAILSVLQRNDPAANDAFGVSIAIDGSSVLVGANFDDDNGANSGSAYLFGSSAGGGPLAYCTAKTSSAGCVASISTASAWSHPNTGANDYFVVADQVQELKNGLLLVGVSGPAALPFGGGLLCVQPPLKRGPVQSSGGLNPVGCNGAFSTLVNTGLVVPNGLDAGPGMSSWCQYWMRDPQNGAGPLGVALSNATRLDFQ